MFEGQNFSLRRGDVVLGKSGAIGFSCTEPKMSVIAPGGSVIYGKEAMDHLKEISEIVYLKMSYEEMEKRIGNVVEMCIRDRCIFLVPCRKDRRKSRF